MVRAALGNFVTLLAQGSPTPDHIPETTRTVALMAVLGIALLGLLMIVGTLLGGHWVRRLGKHRRGPAVPPDVSSARLSARKQATFPPKIPPDGAGASDTFGTDETRTS